MAVADIVNEVPCVNPAAGGACAHPASMHADLAEGLNAGACAAEGCDCTQMVPDPKHPDAPPEADGTTPAKTMPAPAPPADGGKPAVPPAAPAKAPAVPPPAKKAAASTTVEHLADGGLRVVQDGQVVFETGVDPASDPGDPDAAAAGGPGALTFTLPVMVLEGVPTGDRRFITPGALSHRQLPLPLMAVTSTTSGHDGAELVGNIETCERFDASELMNPLTGNAYGAGVFAWRGGGKFTTAENAQAVADLIGQQFLRGVSVDMSDVTSTLDFLDADGNPIDPDLLTEEEFWDAPMQETLTAGRLMGATVCPFPAFEGAYITLDGPDAPATDPAAPAIAASAMVASGRPRFHSITVHEVALSVRDCVACTEGRALVASAGPLAPPASWFDNPEFGQLTPLTVTDDGRIFGHLAAWGQCHTGVANVCTMAPKSRTQYGYFQTGYLVTAEGEQRSVGAITLNTGHAGESLGYGPAKEHYDHTGAAVADVAAGEDAYGIWINGATRPDITELQIRTLRASALSGDWRNVGGNLELVAALAVNVQGFPIVRARVASGMPESLVAAGGRSVIRARPEGQQEDLQRQMVEGLTNLNAFLMGEHKRQLRAQVLAK